MTKSDIVNDWMLRTGLGEEYFYNPDCMDADEAEEWADEVGHDVYEFGEWQMIMLNKYSEITENSTDEEIKKEVERVLGANLEQF